jgi:hypothetical protein
MKRKLLLLTVYNRKGITSSIFVFKMTAIMVREKKFLKKLLLNSQERLDSVPALNQRGSETLLFCKNKK